MPPVIAAISAITLADVLGAVASIAVSFVGNFVIGALTQAIGGDKGATSTGTESHTITVKQPLAPWMAVYGRTRVGGVYVYIHTTGPIGGDYQNARLMGAIVLACHQCDAIEKIYFGDEEITLDADGYAIGRWAGYVRVNKYLGAPGQVADSMLITNSSGTWSSSATLSGRTYIAINLVYQETLFPSMPMISALVRGALVRDTRDNGIRWSDNAALCIFDYLSGTTGYQMAIPLTEFDTANWSAEANACDEIVPTAAIGGVVGFLTVSFTAQTSKVFRPGLGKPAITRPSAFTLPNDNLRLVTGQRVQLSGAGLPTGVSAGVNYWIIRLPDHSKALEELNVVVQPTLQLASSLANAQAGTYVPITTNGSGNMNRMDEFWMQDLNLAALRTGDAVRINSSAGTPPAPFTQNGVYYWIAYGLDQQRPLSEGGNTISYGHGVLATTQQNALRGVAVTINSVGAGQITIARDSERRYTCNGVVDTTAKAEDIIGQMLSSCGGRVVNSGGKWRLFTAIYRAPGAAASLDDSYLRGPIKVQTLVTRRDLFNAVAGTYSSPAAFYQPTNFPAYPNQARPDLDVYLAQDGERIWSSNVALPFTDSPSAAQRLAKILLMQVRQQVSVVYPANLKAFGLSVPDNVRVTNARMGWNAKIFEVVDWTFRIDAGGGDQGPVPGIDLTLRETAPDVFSWDNGVELPDPATDRSHLPNPNFVPTLGGPALVEEIYATQPGAGAKSRIHATWFPVEDGFAGLYQVAYYSSVRNTTIYLPAVTAEVGTEAYLYDLPVGSYLVYVRAINILGVTGLWSTGTSITTRGLTAIPHDLTNFRVAPLNGHAHLTWDKSPDLDVINGGHIWIRWTQNLINPQWAQGSADLLLAGQATEATIFLKAGTYMARAQDSAGNVSANFVAWPLQSVDMPGWQTVIHTNEAPTFPGVKTNLIVSSATLKLATAGPGANVDDWANVDAIADWDGEGSTVPNGQYEFNTVIDLGAIFGFRMELFIDPDEVGGVEGDATVFPEVNTTNDNPASGTAVWSGWQSYLIGDFVARGIKRRVRFQSNEPGANVFVTVLNDDLRMFQRQLTAVGFAVAATTGTRWNFNPPFYSQPFVAGNVLSPVAGDIISLTWDANARSYVQVRVMNAGVAVARSVDLLAYGPGAQQ
jgi:hypothetical protein